MRSVDGFELSNITITSIDGNGVSVTDSSHGSMRDLDITVRRTDGPFMITAETSEQLTHTVTNVVGNGLPVYYYLDLQGGTLDGHGEQVLNIYCARCEGTTIQNYKFPKYTAGGIRLLQTNDVTVQNNTFDGPTMPLLIWDSNGTVIRDNSFYASAILTVPRILLDDPQGEAAEMYNNTFGSASGPVYVYSNAPMAISKDLPTGGNYWKRYDEESEGCFDTDEDMVCDSPYQPPHSTGEAATDYYPWTQASAWDLYVGPNVMLSLPTEGRYAGERGVETTGPYPERGYPDEEVFTFKVVYTNKDNTPPDTIELRVAGSVFTMHADTEALDPILTDGDYTNGEQFVATTTLSKGEHEYEFHAVVGGDPYVLSTDDNAQQLTCMAGYSSIAFVPGLQSSRLFREGVLLENKLWEPNRDGDARQLALNDDGTPLYDDIYTKPGPEGVIDQALGVLTNIYKSFLEDLETWKNDEQLIRDYAVLPYDWRFAYETILGSGVVDEDSLLRYGPDHTTETPYMYEELKSLAETSDSGRIFLVGHSMGGLVIKKMLADMEDDTEHPYRELLGKVDNVALVASPQLGTPKAVASLLHGSEQELDIPVVHYPNFMTDETGRLLGNGLPSTYTLLPSRMYFDRVKDINLEGEEGSYTELIINSNCPTARDYESMLDCFDTANPSVQKDDLITPLQPRSEYVQYADDLHDRLDMWTPPDMDNDGSHDFVVTQIAGWGLSTISAIEYQEKQRKIECPPGVTGTCMETYKDPQPRYTMDGDRTVVVPSAVAAAVDTANTIYVDLYQYNKGPQTNRKHSSIFEIEALRKVIKNITENNNATDDTPDHIHTNYAELDYPNSYMRLALHSPVDIEVQAGEYRVGRRVLSDGGVVYDTDMPNSYYDELGEGKYVGFALTGVEHTINLTGTASGTFTFELSLEEGGVVTETRTFSDVPVTEHTQAKLIFQTLEDVSILPVDTDGDGVVDNKVVPDEVATQVTYETLIDALQELTVPYKYSLIRKAQSAQQFDERNREWIAKMLLRSISRSVTRLSSDQLPEKWRISEYDKNNILMISATIFEKYER
jgi:pimeloyl-ACP methyl ester carboxylesterase